MTPAARLQAAIDVTAEIEGTFTSGANEPADRSLARYLSRRRYIGSKDRRSLSDRVYRILRTRARLLWWLTEAKVTRSDQPNELARRLLLADLVLYDGQDSASIGTLFDGGKYHPRPLCRDDNALISRLFGQRLTCSVQPDWVRAEVPDWLWPDCRAAFDMQTLSELTVLRGEAPLDIRVNRLKATVADVEADLAANGLTASRTPWSPNGLRLHGRPAVQVGKAWRSRWFEPQDEASQIACLLCAVQPGMAVADVCAGAGGKSLALAADLRGQGRLLALDIDARRVQRLSRRANAAGVTGLEVCCADATKPLEDFADSFDRVLVDAPCSGSGTWRRSPDARWRLRPDHLAEYCSLQKALLDRAATLVRSGGRLIYSTCSFLPCENSAQADAFLTRNENFTALPIERVWADTIGGPMPARGPNLQLTPARHGTDGFFVAVFERKRERRA